MFVEGRKQNPGDPNGEKCSSNRKPSLRACFGNRFRVAQANRLCRPATRRTEWEQCFRPIGSAFLHAGFPQFRSAGRRPEQASRPCYPFLKHALRETRPCQRTFRPFGAGAKRWFPCYKRCVPTGLKPGTGERKENHSLKNSTATVAWEFEFFLPACP